jgi:hypothetical protein
MQVTDFNVHEYDLASLGERFNFLISEDFPIYKDFGMTEKHDFIMRAVHEALRNIAGEILEREMITIKESENRFTANVDLVVVDLNEFYKMLDIVKRATGTTFFQI